MCVFFFLFFLLCSVVCELPIMFVLLAASYQNNECACSNLVEGERIVRRFCLFVYIFFLNRTIQSLTIQGLGERKIYYSADGEKLQIAFLSNPNFQHFNRLCCCCCWVSGKEECLYHLFCIVCTELQFHLKCSRCCCCVVVCCLLFLLLKFTYILKAYG